MKTATTKKRTRKSVWKSATEYEPTRDAMIGCIVSGGEHGVELKSFYYSEKTLFDNESWESVCEDWHIVKWCYLDEIVKL